MNYNLLGLIIEAASGESYEAYVQNHIFTPLQMTHSYTSQAEAKQNGMAVGHRYWFAIPFRAEMPIPRGSLPGGELISSSEDMARYLIAHLNEGRYDDAQILSAAGIDELHRPAVEANRWSFLRSLRHGVDHRGNRADEDRLAPWHLPNFFAYMAILPEQKKGVVLLVNANQMMMDFAQWEFGAAWPSCSLANGPSRTGLALFPGHCEVCQSSRLQIVGVAATLRRLLRWHQDPSSLPGGGRRWGRYTASADPRPAHFLAPPGHAVDQDPRRDVTLHA